MRAVLPARSALRKVTRRFDESEGHVSGRPLGVSHRSICSTKDEAAASRLDGNCKLMNVEDLSRR